MRVFDNIRNKKQEKLETEISISKEWAKSLMVHPYNKTLCSY